MNSITPAPWQVCDRGDGTVEVLSSHGCGAVCVVTGTGDEVFANAALIAAAPMLLAALNSCLDRWDDLDEEDCPWLGQDMRDALAQAEGRSE